MNRILLMAWRYVAYHKAKTAILTMGFVSCQIMGEVSFASKYLWWFH